MTKIKKEFEMSVRALKEMGKKGIGHSILLKVAENKQKSKKKKPR